MTAGSPGEVLRIEGLTVRAGDAALVEDLHLAVARGERVGLIGESGSGKSLTALSTLGLLPPGLSASGSVRVAGQEVVGARERRLARLRGSEVAMVFQEPMTALDPTMRVGAQVAEAMTVHGTGAARARARALELLADVRLPDPERVARSYPHQLSGGQRQRVVIAIALAGDPGLLVCDEPTTALDVTVQAGVLDLIVAQARRRDAGLLFISHDLAVVGTVCERVAVMHEGRIVESGTVAEVLTDPRHPYTRRLLDATRLAPLAARAMPGTSGTTASDEATPVLEVDDVTRRYARPRTALFGRPEPVEALRGVSLRLAPGERLGIVGESGCGKSTLLRIAAGLDRPTTGRVRVDGREISGEPDRRLRWLRRRLQLVFQDPMGSLDPRMRVRDIVAEPLDAQRAVAGRGERDARVAELLDDVGLRPESGARHPHQFSGGQRQRISIARALVTGPGILVADEPVSALDVSVRAQVLDLLDRLVAERGLALVFVSHDLSVVRHVCERVVVMEAGRIVEDGPTEQIYADPRHPYTRRLVAGIPTLDRVLAGEGVAALVAPAASDVKHDTTTEEP